MLSCQAGLTDDFLRPTFADEVARLFKALDAPTIVHAANDNLTAWFGLPQVRDIFSGTYQPFPSGLVTSFPPSNR